MFEESSSQVKSWLYPDNLLNECREKANRLARIALTQRNQTLISDEASPETNESHLQNKVLPVQSFASGYALKSLKDVAKEEKPVGIEDEWKTQSGNPLLSAEEEQLLVQFYASKFPSLIGPNATLPKLRRDVKVSSTAALLFRRFFLSNSVMMYDPKKIMVASAFLSSKVEDAMMDVRYLEDGTKVMQAPVKLQEIIQSEASLLAGINFELLCFHPYKAVLAYTEDLRTYLKSEKGKKLVKLSNPSTNDNLNHVIISGEDLRPIHDAARRIIDDVCVSDIPLLYTPGQIGLAAMMVANEDLILKNTKIPQIDYYAYLKNRFEKKNTQQMFETMQKLVTMLKDLREGNNMDKMDILKAAHKKLKKCRAWSQEEEKKKKKRKKRKLEHD